MNMILYYSNKRKMFFYLVVVILTTFDLDCCEKGIIAGKLFEFKDINQNGEYQPIDGGNARVKFR